MKLFCVLLISTLMAARTSRVATVLQQGAKLVSADQLAEPRIFTRRRSQFSR